ncbi:MAG: ribulose bisphosphate carboxylase small subunit [Chloroflexota bacterium]
MKTIIRTETFSYLPPFTEEEVERQIEYILRQGWTPMVEYTDRPGPDNRYWRLWKLPLFTAKGPAEVMAELRACREANPDCYIKLVGYDPKRQLTVVSFVVYRPTEEAI